MSKLKSLNNTFFLSLVSVVVTTLLTTSTQSASQEPKPGSKPGTVTVKATIEAIDPATRTVTLKGPKGRLVKIKASDEVKRFDELKVGDVITASYSESVIIRFRKPGTPDPAEEKGAVVKRAEGKPGGAAVIEETLTVTIEEIDRTTPSVTIRGPGGELYTYRVQDANNIAGLKVGDKADIVYRLGLLLKADAAEK